MILVLWESDIVYEPIPEGLPYDVNVSISD